MANPDQDEQHLMETLYSVSDKNNTPNAKGRISSYENSLMDDDALSDYESDSSQISQSESVLIDILSDLSMDSECDIDLNESRNLNRSEDSNIFLINASSNDEYLSTGSSNCSDINYFESDNSSISQTNSLFDDTYDADFQSENETDTSYSEDEIQKLNFLFEE